EGLDRVALREKRGALGAAGNENTFVVGWVHFGNVPVDVEKPGLSEILNRAPLQRDHIDRVSRTQRANFWHYALLLASPEGLWRATFGRKNSASWKSSASITAILFERVNFIAVFVT